MQQAPGIRERRRQLDAKNTLLRSLARNATSVSATLVDTAELGASWDSLLAGLTQFEESLEQQKGHLAAQVDGNVARLRAKIDALAQKWSEVKPSGAHCRGLAQQCLQHRYLVAAKRTLDNIHCCWQGYDAFAPLQYT